MRLEQQCVAHCLARFTEIAAVVPLCWWPDNAPAISCIQVATIQADEIAKWYQRLAGAVGGHISTSTTADAAQRGAIRVLAHTRHGKMVADMAQQAAEPAASCRLRAQRQ